MTPTFNRDTYSYDLIVDHSVAEVMIYANAIDSKATVSGTGNVALQSGVNEIRITVKAENGSEREYVIHIVRQSNGPTYNAGISGGAGSSAGTGSGTVTAGGPGAVSGSHGSGSSNQSGVSFNAPTSGGSEVVLISPGG